ncbi:Wzz/FepE/Etk N-terminal domain-containing protein [Listeria booriae]|uniref:YveK family protein n=1 Tax=Listeria booriae TaxID=1552123 RepID=UPI00288019D3|nr:Wzz/FepE/Etk N-terminal domain-containing protein [Listeria booriae]MDT0111522.1 Wzz/FepE/Etk N-terminal domain-containing protein [Listeria booriae]
MSAKTMELGVALKIIKNNLIWVIALPLIAMVIAFGISKYYLVPQYTSSAQIFITTNVESGSEKETTVYSEQLRTNMQMANTFNTILKSSRILETVRSEMKLPESNDELANKINIKSDKDSLVFTVSVEDASPERAREIVNKITQTYQKDLPKLVSNNKIIILEPANLPLEPTSPNIVINTMIAFVLGIIGSILLVSLIYLFRNVIEGEADLEEMSLKFVGDIPLIK